MPLRQGAGEEAVDRVVFDQVALDDFGDIFGLNMIVPDAVGVDHHGRAGLTQANRAAGGDDDGSVLGPAFAVKKPLFGQDIPKGFQNGLAAVRTTGLTGTHKHVPG